MSEYTEDCCFNDTRDHCPGPQCACKCHETKRVTRREWETIKIADFERLEAEIEQAQALAASLSEEMHRLAKENTRLRRLLTDAASTSHTAEKHPPYGSSFLDCDKSACTTYRIALAADRAGPGA